MKRILVAAIALVCLILVLPSCSYTLKLNGASIPADMKTIRVDFFENNAQQVVNTLSQQFTEALKDRIRSTTKLTIVRGDAADAIISGSITDYRIAASSVQATNNNNVAPIANASRLTITVNVKYVNNLDKGKKNNFEQSFSQYADFKGDIATQEQALIAQINKQLTEDIFNKAFANW